MKYLLEEFNEMTNEEAMTPHEFAGQWVKQQLETAGITMREEIGSYVINASYEKVWDVIGKSHVALNKSIPGYSSMEGAVGSMKFTWTLKGNPPQPNIRMNFFDHHAYTKMNADAV